MRTGQRSWALFDFETKGRFTGTTSREKGRGPVLFVLCARGDLSLSLPPSAAPRRTGTPSDGGPPRGGSRGPPHGQNEEGRPFRTGLLRFVREGGLVPVAPPHTAPRCAGPHSRAVGPPRGGSRGPPHGQNEEGRPFRTGLLRFVREGGLELFSAPVLVNSRIGVLSHDSVVLARLACG